MLKSSIIDINGIFVGAAVQTKQNFRFVATDDRVEELNGSTFNSLRDVKSAASAAFFGNRAKNIPPPAHA